MGKRHNYGAAKAARKRFFEHYEATMNAEERAAHDVISVTVDGRIVPHAQIKCSLCDNKQLHRLPPGHVPRAVVARYFSAGGWDTDVRAVRCPTCVRERRKGESPKQPEEVEVPMVDVVPLPRKLSADEKFKVRTLLDKQFDETKGVYLADYSDQRIGKEADVPWANVRDIREAAYGPIKAVPVMDGLLSENRALTEIAADLARRSEELRAKVDDLAARISQATQKLGVAA